MISLVRTGREEGIGCVCTGAGGILTGWLPVCLTTRSRPCAIAEPEKITAANETHTDKMRIFVKSFKLKLLVIFFGRAARGDGELLTYLIKNLQSKMNS